LQRGGFCSPPGPVPFQSPTSIGNEITFECTMRGDNMSNYYMSSYRQGPWSAPECIWRGRYTYGEGFQDGFKGSVDESKNRFTLQIRAPKPGDAATYYCGADPPWNSSAAE
uniref:Ig-like domain-containing protein n=1 Tax=Zosterops lateralis melanops TaxID=1220523 RepID=A0A8D2QNY1_ZOSLA